MREVGLKINDFIDKLLKILSLKLSMGELKNLETNCYTCLFFFFSFEGNGYNIRSSVLFFSEFIGLYLSAPPLLSQIFGFDNATTDDRSILHSTS